MTTFACKNLQKIIRENNIILPQIEYRMMIEITESLPINFQRDRVTKLEELIKKNNDKFNKKQLNTIKNMIELMETKRNKQKKLTSNEIRLRRGLYEAIETDMRETIEKELTNDKEEINKHIYEIYNVIHDITLDSMCHKFKIVDAIRNSKLIYTIHKYIEVRDFYTNMTVIEGVLWTHGHITDIPTNKRKKYTEELLLKAFEEEKAFYAIW